MALMTPDAVVLELMTMGQESAAYLADLLGAASPASPHQEVATEILRCCRRVIASLKAGSGTKRKALEHEDATAAAAAARSPTAMRLPPQKRSRGAEALRVVTSGTTVDGSIWRKYGQKEINGHRHPRLYYRCAYSHQGCPATRRVQRTHGDDEPAAFEIAYYGRHTCRAAAAACQGRAALPPPAVVDFGSNAWATFAAASERQLWSLDGEVSLSSASSTEAGFEAQTTHDTAQVAERSAATPGNAPESDPVTEFLNGSFDWASVLDQDRFGFGALHRIAALQ